MLTKYKDVGSQKGVKSPLKNVFMSAAYSEIFSGKSHQVLTYYIFKRIFYGRIILKHSENEKGSRGPGGMLSRKFFEKFHTVMAFLVLFEQILGKFCLNFCP